MQESQMRISGWRGIMGIYTRAGDKGYTRNLLGEKVWKGDLWIELQGSIDEVNAGTGYLRSLNRQRTGRQDLDDMLKWIQYCLYQIGADNAAQYQETSISQEDIDSLEQAIDAYTLETGELHSFIYFSGNEAASYAQVLRSVTRRCERVFAKVLEDINYTLDYQYVNRLADYFFQLARYLNYVNGDAEERVTKA